MLRVGVSIDVVDDIGIGVLADVIISWDFVLSTLLEESKLFRWATFSCWRVLILI